MMTTRSTLASLVALAVALAACLDDGEDGKASAWTAVTLDSGLREPGLDDGGLASGARLELTCPSVVVTDRTLAGYSVRLARAGLPVVGAYVALSPSTGVVVSPQPGGGVTDASGAIAFSFAAPHFDRETPISLEASTRGADGAVIATARCNFQIVTEGLAFVSSEGSPVYTGGPTAQTVRVLARDVVPRCSDGGGVRVGFTDPNRAGVSALFGDAPAATACVDVDPGGAATFFVHPGARGGLARLEATAADYRQAVSLLVYGAPEVITLASDVTEVRPGSAANLTVKVLDDAAQALRGVALSLTLDCAVKPCAPPEKLVPASVTTSADGSARFAYFSPVTPGAATITASVTSKPDVTSFVVLRVE